LASALGVNSLTIPYVEGKPKVARTQSLSRKLASLDLETFLDHSTPTRLVGFSLSLHTRATLHTTHRTPGQYGQRYILHQNQTPASNHGHQHHTRPFLVAQERRRASNRQPPAAAREFTRQPKLGIARPIAEGD
jgi:hypothetical protein